MTSIHLPGRAAKNQHKRRTCSKATYRLACYRALAIQHVSAGKLRVLAVLADTRLATLPDES
jgi:hypothetical protein